MEDELIHCANCDKETTEYCGALYCRACHVSLTLEDCIGNVTVNKMRKGSGLPPI